MIAIPGNEGESQQLLDFLEATDAKTLSESDKAILRKIFDITPYSGLCNMIAKKLVEAKDEDLYLHLIKKIKEVIHTKYVSTLVYWINNYECWEDFQVFIDLIILKSDMCLATAMGVVNDMSYENISTEEIQYGINKLKLYLTTVAEGTSKNEDVQLVIEFLGKRLAEK